MESGWIVRVVDLQGFGGANRSEGFLKIRDAEIEGEVLSAQFTKDVVERLSDSLQGSDAVLDLAFSDDEAVKAGLACGGVAQLAVFREDSFPDSYFDLMSKREPFVTVTVSSPGAAPGIYVLSQELKLPANLPSKVTNGAEELLRSMRRGMQTISEAETTYYLSFVAPPTHLVVLGGGQLAASLCELSSYLGWSADIVVEGESQSNSLKDGGIVLGPLDALVVLSHNHDFTTSFIAETLLSSPKTYVGSLGSRHTQSERRRRLLELGCSDDLVNGIYGPIGIDAAAQSVEETALVICSEIQVHKSGRPLRHLRDSAGPINA